mmetsp:Transcript_104675/g.293370  ORF Transcript_104675/g.293370 Transcript_104675/m.293370 type:complete len:259 (+) Transcript_104675:67-843(+)
MRPRAHRRQRPSRSHQALLAKGRNGLGKVLGDLGDGLKGRVVLGTQQLKEEALRGGHHSPGGLHALQGDGPVQRALGGHTVADDVDLVAKRCQIEDRLLHAHVRLDAEEHHASTPGGPQALHDLGGAHRECRLREHLCLGHVQLSHGALEELRVLLGHDDRDVQRRRATQHGPRCSDDVRHLVDETPELLLDVAQQEHGVLRAQALYPPLSPRLPCTPRQGNGDTGGCAQAESGRYGRAAHGQRKCCAAAGLRRPTTN